MEIFLDTADVNEIRRYKDFIDGVTTNPTLMSKVSGGDYFPVAKEICSIVSGPVSIEVTSQSYDDMLAEAKKIATISNHVCVKLPCTFDGLGVCRELSKQGIQTNMTLCFSPLQALMAAKCGATYVSPFIGRLDDIGQDGVNLIEDIVSIFGEYGYETRVLAASVRNLQHLVSVALLGVDAVTVPAKILNQCFEHPLTTKGLEIFHKDWDNRNKK